ncbi:MAG: TadE/TadG family type IV pilus assembly protein [Chloroflexota bacterium]
MKKLNSERGQSLVELSISLLILLYLLSGAVEFGIAFFQFVQLRDAAQEGALYGSMQPTNTAGIAARVQGASNSPIDLADTSLVLIDLQIDGVPIDTAITAGNACEGHGLEVTVSFNHTVFMPFMSAIVGNTIPLNASVTDTILSPPC